jgi:hypothetical protein
VSDLKKKLGNYLFKIFNVNVCMYVDSNYYGKKEKKRFSNNHLMHVCVCIADEHEALKRVRMKRKE